MRSAVVALVVLVVGCSTGPSPDPMIGPGVQGPASDNPTGTGGEFRLPADMVTASLDVPAAPEEAWPALKQVFEELKIPMREVSEPTRTVRNLRFVVSRRLGGERLSTYLDCGRSASGPNADTYRLQLEIASRVVAVGSGQSRIDTELTGVGMNMEGTSNNRVLCTSNHQLELRIAAGVREIVGGGTP
ncbi:MAG: hypothetical protein ACWGSQ_20820 [Longimicrobiales bacterium]